MVKRHGVRKDLPSKSSRSQALRDADDYLAAGVEHEDAMGKHRGGDPAKSLRFANKARELYMEGLTKYPHNLDLAYNKARLELEIATHPQFTRVLELAPRTVLTWSLTSHEHALTIAPDNADLLFNTAQVLTTLAEEDSKEDTVSLETTLNRLARAVEYQHKCCHLQEVQFNENQEQLERAARAIDEDEDGGVKLDSRLPDSEVPSQWVSIVEPVTTETLVDTLLALLNTLTVTCNIMNSVLSAGTTAETTFSSLSVQVETKSQKVIQGRLAELTRQDLSQEQLLEIELSKANLASALLETAYRMQHINLEQYRQTRDLAFARAMLVHNHPSFAVADANSLISLNAAASVDMTPPIENTASRWNALSKAQTLLAQAAQSPGLAADSDALAKTHFTRGNISLSLHALALPPIEYAQARTNKDQLLRNAEIFYRNASRLCPDSTDTDVAKLRSIVARSLSDQLDTRTFHSDVLLTEIQTQMTRRDVRWIRHQLEDLVDEGLIPD